MPFLSTQIAALHKAFRAVEHIENYWSRRAALQAKFNKIAGKNRSEGGLFQKARWEGLFPAQVSQGYSHHALILLLPSHLIAEQSSGLVAFLRGMLEERAYAADEAKRRGQMVHISASSTCRQNEYHTLQVRFEDA